jgi:hypothetical protein
MCIGHSWSNGGNNVRKYILAFQDDLSKFLVAIPIRQQYAESAAKDHCVKYYTNNINPENKFRLRILPLQRCGHNGAHACRVC